MWCASNRAAGSRPAIIRITHRLELAAARPTGTPTSTSATTRTISRCASDASQVLMWNGVGGSTNVYGAIWPRYRPSDFRKGDEHGLQPDWPMSLRGPRALLRAGRPPDRHQRPRRRPRHAAAPARPDAAAAADRGRGACWRARSTSSGWHWWPAEAAVISEDYDGRPACNGCGICNGCPRGSMSKYSLSVWPKALAAGAKLRTHARVLRIERTRRAGDRRAFRRPHHRARAVPGRERGDRGGQRRRHAAPAAGHATISPTAPIRSGATCCTIRWSSSEMWLDEPHRGPHGLCRLADQPRVRRDRRLAAASSTASTSTA